MMLAWTFAARTADEVAALLRALGRHRYVQEVDHRVHFCVDRALSSREPFRERAHELEARKATDRSLDLASRDPRLWRKADVEEVIAALAAFWSPEADGHEARTALSRALEEAGLGMAKHAPFASDPEEPPHPELIELNWVLWPIDSLDAERHQGALNAMELAQEEVDVSAPVYQEGPCLAAPELLEGAVNGVLRDDWLIWSDGSYSYSDYVLRGAAKAAKLVAPPVGIRDEE